MKVLIVDDSRLARMAVVRALTRLRPEYSYVEAGHPDEALALMKAQPAQIAVIDYNMPGRDGLALTAELRAITPKLSVAILSANAQDEIIAKAAELGARFLVKPLTEAVFETFLNETGAKAGQ